MKPPLKHEGDNDYILELPTGDEIESLWITIGSISVYILAHDDSVQIKLCTRGLEADASYDLDECNGTQQAALDNIDFSEQHD